MKRGLPGGSLPLIEAGAGGQQFGLEQLGSATAVGTPTHLPVGIGQGVPVVTDLLLGGIGLAFFQAADQQTAGQQDAAGFGDGGAPVGQQVQDMDKQDGVETSRGARAGDRHRPIPGRAGRRHGGSAASRRPIIFGRQVQAGYVDAALPEWAGNAPCADADFQHPGGSREHGD